MTKRKLHWFRIAAALMCTTIIDIALNSLWGQDFLRNFLIGFAFLMVWLFVLGWHWITLEP